jgi:hypothetical protein
MYFKVSMRHNPATGLPGGYYRLVESYRNELDNICHRTLLNIGFTDLTPEQLNAIRTLLNDRLERRMNLFENEDPRVKELANQYWNELVSKGKIDVSDKAYRQQRRMVVADTIKNKDAREIGAEWMCLQAVEQLKIGKTLEALGWEEEKIQLAVTQIISRAVYPFSEYRTSRWIKENSAVCELTGYPAEKMTKDKLYQSALNLFKVKDVLEHQLSKRTNELFDLQDRIILYDLTNTYFEGTKRNSKLAQYAKDKSKEKRDDAKLIVLALVINIEGFIKFSSVFEGKKSDSSSLPDIVDKIRVQTSDNKKAIVVLDAGVATDDNLKLLQSRGYDYVCVARAQMKDYKVDPDATPVITHSKAKEKISLERVTANNTTDYILKVQSEGKLKKEQSMKNQFESRFMQELTKAREALSKKGGIKRADKVERRIGRIIEKYPSMARHFDIKVVSKGILATDIIIHQKQSYQHHESHLGTYFIRTSLDGKKEATLWAIYNTIREIEGSFRCLKTDLDLRPIYHKNDDATLAHLHLGLLAYWLVNTIRFQLKAKDIKHGWQEIVRITNTQKVVTTYAKNKYDEIVSVRRCTDPQPKVMEIYKALNYKYCPFTKRKSVVHKPELKNFEGRYPSGFDDG